MPKKAKSYAKKKGNKPKQSAVHLIAIGDEAMQSLNIPVALLKYQEAIPLLESQNDPELASVLSKLAECKVSIGDQEGAREDFERAIQLAPQGPERACLYHYVGQLSSDDEALEAHQRGIQELEQCIAQYSQNGQSDVTTNDDNQHNDNLKPTSLIDLQHHLVRAHCAVAELYLTDLCYAENAEQSCQFHVEMALKLCDPPLPDALQVAASLRLSQTQDASPYILQVYQGMQRGCEALAALVGFQDINEDVTRDNGIEEALELTEVEATNNLPGFEFRCQTAKLLLECAASTSQDNVLICVRAAIQVLGSLLAENDEVVEVWFLLGCAFELNHDLGSAQHYWQHALDMLLKVHEQLMQDATDDDDFLQPLTECEARIEDINHKLLRIGKGNHVQPCDETNDDEMEDVS